MPVSDVVTPLPDQPDPGIVETYASDYDYGSSVPNLHLHAWVDGRVTINGISQQNAFFDREPSPWERQHQLPHRRRQWFPRRDFDRPHTRAHKP
jgi:hypothetical protein